MKTTVAISIVLLLCSKPLCGFSIRFGSEYHRVNPTLFNQFGAFDSQGTTFSSGPTTDTVNALCEIFVELVLLHPGTGLKYPGGSQKRKAELGVYGRYVMPATVQVSGEINGLSYQKTSRLLTYTLGPFFALTLLQSKRLSLKLAVSVGMGPVQIDQSIRGAEVSSLRADATAFEGIGEVRVAYLLTKALSVMVRSGYQFERTNFLAVKSITGTEYGSLMPGNRLTVISGSSVQDFRLDLSGLFIGASLGIEL